MLELEQYGEQLRTVAVVVQARQRSGGKTRGSSEQSGVV
jgi:hypothetical protein